MELTYSAQTTDFDPDKRYRNPEHFDRVEPGAVKVVVVGDWPRVVDAYEGEGVEVSIIELQKAAPQQCAAGTGRDEALHAEISGIRSDLKSVALIVESFVAQRLERPEGELGETAGRLFEILESVNAGIASLQLERDGEIEKACLLQKQVDDLLAQAAKHDAETDEAREAKEIAELKARLDAAKVQYRVNASKDSLERLSADLPKA
ncbi:MULTISPECIES: hypothetical protein [unclassified Pseudomonas]|uniref:hypothetical protein n=1 Tax=Pseudomonas TaxID=286 RepID=UPI000A1E8087|nr:MULTISPECIES: hypothetical protein [unclassified Pseudomonas]